MELEPCAESDAPAPGADGNGRGGIRSAAVSQRAGGRRRQTVSWMRTLGPERRLGIADHPRRAELLHKCQEGGGSPRRPTRRPPPLARGLRRAFVAFGASRRPPPFRPSTAATRREDVLSLGAALTLATLA